MRSHFVLAASAVALAVYVSPTEAVVIDDFSVGPLVILGANATVQQTQSGLDPVHVLGGNRSISYRSFSTPPTTLTIDSAAGTLNISPGNCCTYLDLSYGSAANPLQSNLLAEGSDQFVIAFTAITAEIPSSLPSIFATDNQNRIATILGSSSMNVPPTGPFSISVPFSQFPSFDFSNVQSFRISVSRYGGGTGAAGKSFTMDSIVTVPETAGIWYVGIAVVVSGHVRFRLPRCQRS